MIKKLHVKNGDTVIVKSGNSKGTFGKVIGVSPKEGKIIVEGVNLVKKHLKPRPPKENGGIVDAEAPFYASKAQIYCDKCKAATRVKHEMKGDAKVRVCAKCGAEL